MTHTAYVTRDEFERSPTHSIDTSDLVPGGTVEQNATALDEILDAASLMVDAEIDVGTLVATIGTVERHDAYMNRRFEINVRPKNRPINSVANVRYRARGSSDWTSVSASAIEVADRTVSVIVNVVPTIADQPIYGASSYLHPSEVDRLTKIPLIVELTYNHGYATIPQDVKTATILFAAALIKQRGSVSLTMDGTPSVMGGNPYDRGDEDRARELLRRYKR